MCRGGGRGGGGGGGGIRSYFLKKRRLSMENLTKERKQPPVVFLQQSIFSNIFIRCLWLRIIRKSVYFINFLSHIFFDDINHGYRAAILKKSYFGCFHFIWLWVLIAIMKRWEERRPLQLYRTSLTLFFLMFSFDPLENRKAWVF